MCKTVSQNSSALRSRRLLTDALLELMAEKPLAHIAVGEVCARAQLTRPTFYNHFSSKENVLETVMDELFDQFVSSLDEHDLASTTALVSAYFRFWEKRRDLLTLLRGNHLFSLMGDRFANHLTDLYQLVPFHDASITADELAYHNAFLSGGMVGILEHWARCGMGNGVSAADTARYATHALSILQAGATAFQNEAPAPTFPHPTAS